MTNIVIASAARTPVGSFNGSFANVPAHDLGAAVIRAVLERAGVEPGEVSETILGQVLTAGQGQNPARQAHINAGLPKESAAWSINQVCGSGLRTVALGAQHIMLGDDSIVVAGGQESMSLSPHAAHLRAGQKMGDMKFVDTMIKDGLWDAFNGYHMGTTAENVATQWQISREQQDEFALASQNKAEAAQKAGRFADEIAAYTVKTRKGDVVVDKDEYIRIGATLDGMTKLKPAFSKDGTVTAGNASGLNDGAAAVLLMTADEAEKRGIEPLARIASWATAGVDPSVMGSGPIPASSNRRRVSGAMTMACTLSRSPSAAACPRSYVLPLSAVSIRWSVMAPFPYRAGRQHVATIARSSLQQLRAMLGPAQSPGLPTPELARWPPLSRTAAVVSRGVGSGRASRDTS